MSAKAAGRLRACSEHQSHKGRVPVSGSSCRPAIDPEETSAVLISASRNSPFDSRRAQAPVQQHAASFTAHTEAVSGSELLRFIKDEFDASSSAARLPEAALRRMRLRQASGTRGAGRRPPLPTETMRPIGHPGGFHRHAITQGEDRKAHRERRARDKRQLRREHADVVRELPEQEPKILAASAMPPRNAGSHVRPNRGAHILTREWRRRQNRVSATRRACRCGPLPQRRRTRGTA